jgi:hypothetical protein
MIVYINYISNTNNYTNNNNNNALGIFVNKCREGHLKPRYP